MLGVIGAGGFLESGFQSRLKSGGFKLCSVESQDSPLPPLCLSWVVLVLCLASTSHIKISRVNIIIGSSL